MTNASNKGVSPPPSRVYGHATMAMHDMSNPSLLSSLTWRRKSDAGNVIAQRTLEMSTRGTLVFRNDHRHSHINSLLVVMATKKKKKKQTADTQQSSAHSSPHDARLIVLRLLLLLLLLLSRLSVHHGRRLRFDFRDGLGGLLLPLLNTRLLNTSKHQSMHQRVNARELRLVTEALRLEYNFGLSHSRKLSVCWSIRVPPQAVHGT